MFFQKMITFSFWKHATKQVRSASQCFRAVWFWEEFIIKMSFKTGDFKCSFLEYEYRFKSFGQPFCRAHFSVHVSQLSVAETVITLTGRVFKSEKFSEKKLFWYLSQQKLLLVFPVIQSNSRLARGKAWRLFLICNGPSYQKAAAFQKSIF